jgi:hypothetical protein
LFEGAEEEAEMDQVELVVPCPVLGYVVYFKDAVGGDPGYGRGIQVNPVDGN